MKIDIPLSPEMLKIAKLMTPEQLKAALITLINQNMALIYDEIKKLP